MLCLKCKGYDNWVWMKWVNSEEVAAAIRMMEIWIYLLDHFANGIESNHFSNNMGFLLVPVPVGENHAPR